MLSGERDTHEGARCSVGSGVLTEDRDDGSIWAEDVGEDGLAVTPAARTPDSGPSLIGTMSI